MKRIKSVKRGKQILKERIKYFKGELQDVKVALGRAETDAQTVALETLRIMYEENIDELESELNTDLFEDEKDPEPIRFVKTEEGAKILIDGDALSEVLENLFGENNA